MVESYRLKDSDICFSRMALGTWGYSGAEVWGKNDDEVSIRTINEAIDNGITVFDSSPRYGDGKAEEVLGKAVRNRRSEVVICTKVRLPHRDEIIASCNESLKRLGTDYIDIFQVHWPFRDVPMEETLGAYEELKRAGKIREIGVCNFGPGCIDASKGHRIVTNQLPYALIWRLIEKNGTLDKSIAAGMTIWAYVPLAQGLLTGKFHCVDDVPLGRRNSRFYSSSWKQGRHTDSGFEDIIFPFLARLGEVSAESGYSMVELAFGFLKAQKAVSSILVGCRNPEQLRMNLKAFEKRIPDDVIEHITELSESLKERMGMNADLWENGDGGKGRIY